MKKQFFLWLLLLLALNVFAEEFVSLHQLMNQSIQTPTGYVNNLIGFNNQYSPNNNVTACDIGMPNTSAYCTAPRSVLAVNFPDFPTATAMKLYIPQGTIGVRFSAFMAQGVHVAIAAKLDVPPTHTAPLSDAEYENYRSLMVRDSIFENILTGQEQILVHPGGGTFTMFWGYTKDLNPTTKGHWLYFRIINNYQMFNFSGATLIDKDAYKTGYASIQWDVNGDPVDTASGTSPVVNPTPITTPLTGISLSASSLVKGSASTVAITPTPSNASLGTCTTNRSDLVAISGNTISLAAGANAITTATPVTITCGSVSQSLTIAPNTVPLTGVTLSRSSIASTDTTTRVVLSPSPAGAALPSTCKVLDTAGTESNLVTSISSSGSSYGFTVLSGTANLVKLIGQNQLLSVDCGGGVKTAFTVLMPLVAKSLIGNALEFNFLPSGTATTADLYIAGYIKDILPNKLTGKVESAWICRSYDDSNWVYMPGAILPRVCKRSGIKVNDKVRITIDATDIAGIGNSSFSEYFFTFSEKTLKDAKVELYGAYTTDNGTTFKFIGDDNTGTFSAQPPVGANVNALYIFK